MAPSPGQHLSITSQQKKIIKTFSAVIIDIFFSKAATALFSQQTIQSCALIFEIRAKTIEDTALLPREKKYNGRRD